MDCVIAVASLLSLAFRRLSAIRAIRTLRVLRPLRMIKRVPALRKIVNALIRSLPACAHFVYVFLLVMLVFAIMGLRLFMGRTASCSDPSVRTSTECTGTFVDDHGELALRRWANPDYINFDWIGGAMLTLFEMSTLEAWSAPLFRTMDIVGYVRAASGFEPSTGRRLLR